jgi:hypothetical protein
MSIYLDEAQVEFVTVDYFCELGYEYVHGPQIALEGATVGRPDRAQVVFVRWLQGSLLPKLLSGEIELPAAEAAVEEVGS